MKISKFHNFCSSRQIDLKIGMRCYFCIYLGHLPEGKEGCEALSFFGQGSFIAEEINIFEILASGHIGDSDPHVWFSAIFLPPMDGFL